MAAVAIQIRGTLYDLTARTTQQIVIQGDASLLGLGVGGGPIVPPEGGQPPLGIWGPPDMPPGFWGGGMGPGVKPQPRPEHPIVIPPAPEQPPENPSEPKPPPPEGGWGWHPEYGWGYFPMSSGPAPHK